MPNTRKEERLVLLGSWPKFRVGGARGGGRGIVMGELKKWVDASRRAEEL